MQCAILLILYVLYATGFLKFGSAQSLDLVSCKPKLTVTLARLGISLSVCSVLGQIIEQQQDISSLLSRHPAFAPPFTPVCNTWMSTCECRHNTSLIFRTQQQTERNWLQRKCKEVKRMNQQLLNHNDDEMLPQNNSAKRTAYASENASSIVKLAGPFAARSVTGHQKFCNHLITVAKEPSLLGSVLFYINWGSVSTKNWVLFC